MIPNECGLVVSKAADLDAIAEFVEMSAQLHAFLFLEGRGFAAHELGSLINVALVHEVFFDAIRSSVFPVTWGFVGVGIAEHSRDINRWRDGGNHPVLWT